MANMRAEEDVSVNEQKKEHGLLENGAVNVNIIVVKYNS